ncbi:MAG: hypothetical protein H0W72_16835 [Planctomycetes bacterium]|nr:hypothetical protein [Planctomycetota bacterium]
MLRALIILVAGHLVSMAGEVRDEAGVITDADGTAVVTYAARIPTLGPKDPPPGLIVALHPINGNQKQLIDVFKQSLQASCRESGYVVLSLKSQGAGWEAVDQVPIRKAVAWAIATHHVDPRRVFAWGYGHGAIWLGQFAVDAQEIFAGAVLWAGTCNRMPDDSSGLSYYVVHGDSDPTVKPDNIRAARDRMRQQGVRLVYREFAGGEHRVPFDKARGTWGDHIAWMDALRNTRIEPDAKTGKLFAKAGAELDKDGKLTSTTAKLLFPALLESAGATTDSLIVRCLTSTTASMRRSAAALCAQRVYGDSVMTALLPLLDDADKACQAQALLALGLAADFQIAPAQTTLCDAAREHARPAVRNAALQALLPALRAQKGTVSTDN